jgi:hypothetical protein
VGRLERADFAEFLEKAGQAMENERFPLAESGGMDAELSGELRDQRLLFEEFLDDLCFEGGRELLPHVCDPSRRARLRTVQILWSTILITDF